MGSLMAASRVDRAVVAENTDGKALDGCMSGQGLRSVVGLKVEKIGVIDQTNNHLAHIHRFAEIGRHDAEQIFGRVTGGKPSAACNRSCNPVNIALPAEPSEQIACNADGLGVVASQILTQSQVSLS